MTDLIEIGFHSLAGFELLQRQAQMFAKSSMVPDSFKNNVPNCCIALEMAHRMRASPLAVMQNLYIVYGNPSWSAKFLIAAINTCGRYYNIDYEEIGEDAKQADYRIRAYAIEKSTDRKLCGEWIDWQMVRSEGWDSKKGSKWQTMPGQMFRYRAAAFWQRTFCPEISMGLMNAEEVLDTGPIEKEIYGEALPKKLGESMDLLRENFSKKLLASKDESKNSKKKRGSEEDRILKEMQSLREDEDSELS